MSLIPERGVRVVSTLTLIAAGLASAPPAHAQQKPLTLEAIFDPQKKVEFGGTPVTGLVWLSDTHYLWPKADRAAGTVENLKVDAVTGQAVPFFDAARVESVLAKADGVSAESARQAVRARALTMNAAHTALLLALGGDLYAYDLAAHTAVRLTNAAGVEDEAAFSPDGKSVSFVRNNDLYVVPAAGGAERRLTTDGSAEVQNGKLDWVYQEEVYGRGNFRGYWWSPDSSRIAYLQLDEKGVPRYTLVDDVATHPTVEVYPYPKAGDPNPRARLGVVDGAGGASRWVDLGTYAAVDPLVVDVAWRPDGALSFQVQDREQTWLDLELAAAATGAAKTLFRETTSAWVERDGSPRWLPDGSFLWLSGRGGWKHIHPHPPHAPGPRT